MAMSIDNYQSAVDLPVGKADADSSGLARYSLKIRVPPGPGQGNEPDLSLQYCHGCPNSSLGLGWALGGLSCIRRTPSSLAYDGANVPPPNHQRFEPKFSLDDVELLNVTGNYGAKDAEYTTEIDHIGKIVSHLDNGFLVRDSTGFRKEYGTTPDSQVMASEEISEWRLKRQIDRHGNCMVFTYAANPRHDSASEDVNTCYLTEIRYSSNVNTGHPAARIVTLEYTSRTDHIVQTLQGRKAVWASLLSSIRVGVVRGSSTSFYRAYELAYETNADNGDSCLASVTETAGNTEEKIRLLPHRFTYTSNSSMPAPFELDPKGTTILHHTSDSVALFTMNISGRGLPDIACIRWNQRSKSLSVKTYLAFVQSDNTTKWVPSDGQGFEASLPMIDLRNGFPSILTPDINRDGRPDLIIPYKDGSNMLRFSISQSTGTGFTDYYSKEAMVPWAADSRFMTVDLTGRGITEIVQIYSCRSKLTLKSFSATVVNGKVNIEDGKPTVTDLNYSGTIDWFVLNHVKTGAASLVRIWAEDQGRGMARILATSFSTEGDPSAASAFNRCRTSVLWESVRFNEKKFHVIPCDINADGVQDVLLATVETKHDEIALSFTTFLGDGQGSFDKHGATITRQISTAIPLMSEEPGRFHVSNLDGSNYPSISYIYQERNGPSHTCLTVNGLSNGQVSEIRTSRLKGNMPAKNMELTASDLNGNGIGDWLFHTVENGQPKIVPFYNQACSTGLLEWSVDPMGLETAISYGTLVDPNVYTPAVCWKDYNNVSDDSYSILGTSNYVVTQLDYRNHKGINDLPYELSIKREYSSATVSTKGRGWQGFGTVRTINSMEAIDVIDEYHSLWPFTGQKKQTITKPLNGPALKTESFRYEKQTSTRGPWNIYSVNKVLEETTMLDAGEPSRCDTTEYVYDEYGNVTTRHSYETVHGALQHESWHRFTYTTINGITGLMTSRKISSNMTESNSIAFEKGDASLLLCKYDEQSARPVSEKEWNTDVGAFATKKLVFDSHGNEIETVDSAGLRVSTTYDKTFCQFPIKVETIGSGVSAVELRIYDEFTGHPVAKMEEPGSMECRTLDLFGRPLETRLQCPEMSFSTHLASEIFTAKPLIGDEGLLASMHNYHLAPYGQIEYPLHKGPSGRAYIGINTASFSDPGLHGTVEVLELMDCAGRAHKRFTKAAANPGYEAMFREYDSVGHCVFEAFPSHIEDNIDWTPDRSQGLEAKFDTLGRQILQSRPARDDPSCRILTMTEYLDGSSRVVERVLRTQSGLPLESGTQLASVTKRYIKIDEKDFLTEIFKENNLRSTFSYDVIGNMVLAVDPAGNQERRTYNSNRKLTSIQHCYQCGTDNSHAVQYQYDISGRLVSQTNAAQETKTFKRDAKGRLLQETGHDGRTIIYTYSKGDMEQPTVVTTYGSASRSVFESQFEFNYNSHGNETKRALTLGDGRRYSTQLIYDWQNRLIKKILPDGAVLTNCLGGDRLLSCSLSGTTSTWNLKATLEDYNTAAQGPGRISLSGTGIPQAYEHEWNYDKYGLPTSHTLHTGTKSLVQEHYRYNDMNQTTQKHEFVSGSTITYSYHGSRLHSSTGDDGSKASYNFDTAGNLISKDAMSMAYSMGKVKGTKDSSTVFDVSYDLAGRMVQKTTSDSTFVFEYDSFGRLQRYRDDKSGKAVEVLADFIGVTLQKRYSDGTSELNIDEGFSIYTAADGSCTAYHKLSYDNILVGTVSNRYESAESKRPLGNGNRAVNIHFTDTKGNLTHSFEGETADINRKYKYDDFGLLLTDPPVDGTREMDSTTYEGKSLDSLTGLIDFGGRWYDPSIGRFTSPDDILEIDYLAKTDGLNRYVFENNDPINHIDPTGHWSWSTQLGLLAGVLLVTAAIAVTIATGGAAGIFLGALVGGLAAGGAAGIKYSVDHQDEEDAGKFWGGFTTTVAVNAFIGAIAGALGAAAATARGVAATARVAASTGLPNLAVSIAGKAVLGGITAVLGKASERAVSNAFYGTDHSLFADAGETFVIGFATGAAVGLLGNKA
ncbi:hypothetical protein ACLX1H_009471 [Fusarium chlamydosporum]